MQNSAQKQQFPLQILNTQMVDNQLRTAGVFNADVIDAFLAVNRAEFVPNNLRALAFSDATISLAAGRFMLSPLVLGKMLQAFPNVAGKTVLIYGAATGYSAALLAKMGADVIAVQSNAEIATFAREALKNTNNVKVLDCGFKPAEVQTTFDIILIEGCVFQVPDEILEKLKSGGVLLTIIAGKSIGAVTQFIKTDKNVSKTVLFEANAPVLPGFEAANEFVF